MTQMEFGLEIFWPMTPLGGYSFAIQNEYSAGPFSDISDFMSWRKFELGVS